MPALGVAVLDVVVDEREVVAELDGGSARERQPVVAGDAGVGEEAEQRPDPLAARRARTVEPEVVPDHLVQPTGGRIVVTHEADDLGLGVGDQGGQVEILRGGRHGAIVHETCSVQVACWQGRGDGRRPKRTLEKSRENQ